MFLAAKSDLIFEKLKTYKKKIEEKKEGKKRKKEGRKIG